ncbi:unnamed protein product [Amoebophrya sp. A25]|nr:unnamed protein product [Amoebophrya sp. A25]|eukprot:GSA25T00015372001.1
MLSCLLWSKGGRGTQLTLRRTRIVNGRPVFLPFGFVEDFGFFIALVCEEDTRLAGVFVFPRCYLVKWGICGEQLSGGQTAMTLYPPGHNNPAAYRHAKCAGAEEQRKFYIDLTHTADTVTTSLVMIDKFRSIIVESHGENDAPPSASSVIENKT